MKLENVTGNIICKKIKSKHIQRILFMLLVMILGGLFIGYAVHSITTEHEYLLPLIAMIFGVVCIIGGIYIITLSIKVLTRVQYSMVFLKYGSPESIAEIIADGANSSIVSCKQTILTDKFILKKNDFETFVPLESILLLYKKEHRTNGILDSVSLVVHDEYGDDFEYPFKLGKKYEGEFNLAGAEIAKHAPNARFGYTKENLAYVKQNAKKV